MREIKFRGMDIDGRWFYGNLAIVPKDTANHKAGHYISNSAGMPFAYRVRPETVGQLAGLTDRNGEIREIYEGDLYKIEGNWPVYEVKYSEKYACFGLGSKGPFYDFKTIEEREYEIVYLGNKYENPELLEVTA